MCPSSFTDPASSDEPSSITDRLAENWTNPEQQPRWWPQAASGHTIILLSRRGGNMWVGLVA